MKFFSEVIFLPELPKGGPALVNVRTGVLRLSKKYWDNLPEIWKKFILYHELGHLNGGKSEEAAQLWAIKRFIQDGYSVKEIIRAHTEVYPWEDLNDEKKEGLIDKVWRAVEIAKHFDYHLNGNHKALESPMTHVREKYQSRLGRISEEEAEFLGFGKKARERREQRREDKQAFKLEKIAAKAEGRATVAQAGGGLANGLKNAFAGIGSALGLGAGGGGGLLANAAGALSGAGGGDAPMPDAPAAAPAGNGKMIIIIGVVIAIAIIGIIIWKKKSKKS